MPNIKKPHEINADFHDLVSTGKLYDDYIPSQVSLRQYEEVKISSDKTTLKLIDKNQRDTLSLISGDFTSYYNKSYFEVSYTWSKYERYGFLTYLFEVLVYDLDHIVMSDRIHTSPGSKEFWQSLIRRSLFEIYRFNTETNYKKKARNYREDQIWGLTLEEKEIIDKEKAKFDSFSELKSVLLQEEFINTISNPDISENDENQLLGQLDSEIEGIPQINEYKAFMTRYKMLTNSKENIRLIAQKK